MASEILPQDPRINVLLARSLRLVAEALEAKEPPDTPINEDRLLTTAEAAARLRCSPQHITVKCKAGAIKAMKDGNRWRMRQSALATYERRRTR